MQKLCMAHKAKNTSYLDLYSKCWLHYKLFEDWDDS